jgi:hypothetical protein
MWRNLDATVFVEHPTQIEYLDGHFLVVDNFGGTTLRRCYSPHVFLASLKGANAALAKWQQEQREVAEFPRRAVG